MQIKLLITEEFFLLGKLREKQIYHLFVLLIQVQQIVLIKDKSLINLVMFLSYDHNPRLESEELITSEYCCYISATVHECVVSDTGMKDRARKRPFTSSFQIIFMVNLASYPQLTKLQAGLSFLLPSLARLDQIFLRDVFSEGKEISDLGHLTCTRCQAPNKGCSAQLCKDSIS